MSNTNIGSRSGVKCRWDFHLLQARRHRMMALLPLFVFLTLVSSAWTLTCKNAQGQEVDWYATYKVPKLRHLDKMFLDGLAHFYLDPIVTSWTLSKQPINDSGQAIFNTLQQIYTTTSCSVLYLMYNDEIPPSDVFFHHGGGHTKGMVGFDQDGGFWLVHSVPKFPPKQSKGYQYPPTGQKYGQTFLCISFPYKQLGKIAEQLFYNEPHLYDSNVPSAMSDDFPRLVDVVEGKSPQTAPWYHITQLISKGEQKFTSFAKSSKFGSDLYEVLIAPTLKTDILVETWVDGHGKLPTNCSIKYRVFDIQNVSLPYGANFTATKDHAKWVVSVNKGKVLSTNSEKVGDSGHWTCIGDINHMHSQWSRGGGSVCKDDLNLWKAFRTIVSDYQPCQ